MMTYLDHAATTPMLPEVLTAMQPYFLEHFGNASSVHGAGRRAHVALTQARRTLATLIGAKPNEIIFTSGGTEGANTALRGIALARRAATGANRIIVSAIEHHAVLHTAEDLRDHYGFELMVLPVNFTGRLEIGDWRLGDWEIDKVALVSVMMANNEIGVIEPVREIGSWCRARSIPFHTDAVQAAGKLPLKVDELQVDALSVSAHKFYGPKGIGFLYLRNGTPFQPILTGGSHENSRRAGTENVPAIVGMAKAFEIAERDREVECTRLQQLRDHLIGDILEAIDGAMLTGAQEQRVCNIASFVIPGVEAEAMLIALDLAGIAASSGSACTSASQKPSHVLEAIGVAKENLAGALRFSLGRSTTTADIERVIEVLPRIVTHLRSA
ncbi:MAG: cysteine desulfurase family protein [Caldilineaceae bacterium]